MKYKIQRDETVSEGIKRIIDGKVKNAIEHIDNDGDRHEAVHDVRKRCKEVRAALRLVRTALTTYNEENAHYRDAARRISDLRDAHALIETFDKHVIPAAESADALNEQQLAEVRAELVDRRETMTNEQNLEDRLADVRQDLVEGRRRVENLPIATEGFDAVAGGLRTSYKRAHNRMEEAYEDPTDERFHEWRKRVKYQWYHTRLLQEIWPKPMKARRSELKSLADFIGDDHDLAVFLAVMDGEKLFDSETRETLQKVIMGPRSELQRKSRPLGERLFAETPDEFIARMRRYWDVTREYEP